MLLALTNPAPECNHMSQDLHYRINTCCNITDHEAPTFDVSACDVTIHSGAVNGAVRKYY